MFLRTYSTAVLCAVFIITGAVSGEEVKKAVDETVSFRLPKLGSPVTSITWKQIKGGTVKAIEWDDEGVSIPNPRFKGFTSLDKETGQITITNLKLEHSGIYTIDINSKEQEQRFTLEVMERVPKPVITIEKSTNHDVAYLKCEYKETIIWKNSAGDKLEGKKNHTPGEFITVNTTRTPNNFYTCTLKNAVSEETSDPVYERDLFETDGGPWWIALIVLVIPILLVASFILPYKCYDPFHTFVYNNLKDKPCIGAILNRLDGTKKDDVIMLPDPPKSSSDAENGEGIREKTETDPLKADRDAENGAGSVEKTETDPLTSSSDAENDPLKADRDAENGAGSVEKTETDPLTPAENGEELLKADRDGGDKEDHL